MMNGVEIRMPFLDYRVVTFLLALPWTSKVRGGYNKAIIRDAFQDLLPLEISKRADKMGFNTPMHEWMKTIWREFLLDTISSQDFNSCSLINAGKVRDKIHKCIYKPNTTFRDAELAWSALMPFLWEKYFLKEILKDCK